MADSITQLGRKIASAADLQSVVRAMKAQAAASVGQYASSVAALGDYARTVELGLAVCFRPDPLSSAALPDAPAEVAGAAGVAGAGRAINVVVFGSDQGLVGRFNDTLVEHARQTLADRLPGARIWAVGERMRASLADGGMAPQDTFAVPATVQAITGLVGTILRAVVDASATSGAVGAASELHLFHNRPTTSAAYAPVGQRLLPLDEAWRRELAEQPWPTQLLPEVLGDPATTLRNLIREYLFVSIFRASAESLASENTSRLAAMERADRNIDQMLGVLQGRFHRLRQSRIDEELSDVTAGFKALSRIAAP
jgi:F-type H+-transporting ATPase subunit gamma